MVKFDNNALQGFRTVMAALRRYTRDAPQVIEARVNAAAKMLIASRQNEVMELMKTVQPFATYPFPRYNASGDGVATQQSTNYPFISTSEAPMPTNPRLNRKSLLLEDSEVLQTVVGNEAEDKPVDKETIGVDSLVKD
jgi:hypothetical protein